MQKKLHVNLPLPEFSSMIVQFDAGSALHATHDVVDVAGDGWLRRGPILDSSGSSCPLFGGRVACFLAHNHHFVLRPSS